MSEMYRGSNALHAPLPRLSSQSQEGYRDSKVGALSLVLCVCVCMCVCVCVCVCIGNLFQKVLREANMQARGCREPRSIVEVRGGGGQEGGQGKIVRSI